MKKLFVNFGIVASAMSLCGACNSFDAAEPSAQTSPSSPMPAPEPIQCGTMADRDGDGWFAIIAEVCLPENVVYGEGDDCDDTDPTRNVPLILHPDVDGDGFGTNLPSSRTLRVCSGDSVEGYAVDQTDCDDTSSAGHEHVYRDADGDGFGSEWICGEAGEGFSFTSGDCRDDDSMINPDNMSEVAFDGADVNCDGFDAPDYDPGTVITWSQPTLCTGAVLAVVGFEWGGASLYVANIGTAEVNDATLVARRLGGSDVILETLEFVLPALRPGEVMTAGRFASGHYQVRFQYSESALPSADTTELHDETDAQAATTLAIDLGDAASSDAAPMDAGVADAGSNEAVPNSDGATNSLVVGDAGQPWEVDGERCERAKQPLRFSTQTLPAF